MKKIIVPVDFSKHSYYALEVAANLAKKIDASLFICHILDLPHMSLSDGDTPCKHFFVEDDERKNEENYGQTLPRRHKSSRRGCLR